jgi:type III secretion protein R
MRIPKLSIKAILCCMAFVLMIEMLPSSLYSQQVNRAPTPSTSTEAKTPASTLTEQSSVPGRITTSVKATPAASKKPETELPPFPEMGDIKRPSLITQGMMLTLLSLLPFMIMTLTSFLKIVIVLSLLRTALGVQQAPPNQVINGVAFLLSLFIMYPTALKMYDSAYEVIHQNQVPESFLSHSTSTYVLQVAKAASGPMRDFMKRNSMSKHQALFYRLIYRGLPDQYRETLKPDDFMVLVPSYITGQLKDAFEIGVLIYIPFFVIDLVTSNILLAMGMMMLSPVTISMPLKLFLLVMLDGWTILIEGLVKTFQ